MEYRINNININIEDIEKKSNKDGISSSEELDKNIKLNERKINNKLNFINDFESNKNKNKKL